MADKIVFWNGNILTMDSEGRRAEALAVVDGKISAVGTNLEIRKLYGDGWKSIDLQGKTVLPGFIDSHVHLMATAITAIGIDLAEARSLDEIRAKV
jgi:predicted amidohydrolase YtcJ